MSIDLTGWKVKEPGSSMCGRPELSCPVYNISEYFMGYHWAKWTSDKVDISLFVKLSDRISNVKFGWLLDDGKGMFRKYQKEHADFYNALHSDNTEFGPMWDELEYLCSLK